MSETMGKVLEGLNAEQVEAVSHGDGPLLIFAGAGSGKTRVLTHRAAYLIASGRAKPDEIIAVTFTNKAANELRERLMNLLCPSDAGVWAGTFHSFCARLLRRHITRLGRKPSFTIFDEADQLSLIKQCVNEAGIGREFSPGGLLHRISRVKERGEGEEELLMSGERDPVSRAAAKVYPLYQSRLEENNALDFDDLILMAVRLLEDDRKVRREHRSRCSHLLVDEYQDINAAQYRLIRALTPNQCNLCVVGDDDQSIYGWRGANVEFILRFQEDFPEAKVVKLEQNYRSTQNILDAAFHVISKNTKRATKRLWTAEESGERLVIFDAPNEQEEAYQVASIVKQNLESGSQASDFAVLYRTNAQSRAYEESFAAAPFRIPYRLVGSVGFYERAEVKDILCYLKVVQNPDDSVSLLRIINVPRRGIGDTSIARLQEFATRQGIPLFEALILAARKDIGLGKAQGGVTRLVQLLEDLQEKAKTARISEILRDAIDGSGYRKALEEEHNPQAAARLDNLEELERSADGFPGDLTSFMERAALFSRNETTGLDGSAATLMTVHSAKGLEFDTVFLVGMEEGLFPNFRSSEEQEDLEEERRLCYVGLTRARKKVYLSHAVTRSRFGSTEARRPSTFLTDIPDHLVDKSGWSFPRRPRPVPTVRRGMIDLRRAIARRREGTPAPSLSLSPGDKVRHQMFGPGTVVKIPLTEGDDTVTVAFDEVGLKKLALSLAPLEKLA